MRARLIKMRRSLLLLLLLIYGCAEQPSTQKMATSTASEDSARSSNTPQVSEAFANVPVKFAAPIQLVTEAGPIAVEEPGYASPCWADMDRDGIKDLLVGQFSGGKIRVYKNLGGLKFASGEWLQAGGAVAQVPGVW